MKHVVELIAYIVIMGLWLAGIAIANGLRPTVFAIFLPPYAWYLVVERILQSCGII